MGERRYDPDHKAALDAMLLGVPGITAGQMMGHPIYKIAGKMFACLMPNGVAIKLPPEDAARLLTQDHTAPWAPGGTVFRQWVQIILPRAEDAAAYQDYLERSVSYVLELAEKDR